MEVLQQREVLDKASHASNYRNKMETSLDEKGHNQIRVSYTDHEDTSMFFSVMR